MPGKKFIPDRASEGQSRNRHYPHAGCHPEDASSCLERQDSQPVVERRQSRLVECAEENSLPQPDRRGPEDSPDLYRDLFELSPVASLILDTDGIIQEANLTAASLLKARSQDPVGKPFSFLVNRRDHEVFHSHCRRVFEKGHREVCEIRLIGTRENDVHVRVASISLKARDEADPRCLTALVEIAEHKERELELRQDLELHLAIAELYAPLSSPDLSLADVADVILAKAKSLTKSELGCVSKLDGETVGYGSETLAELIEIVNEREPEPSAREAQDGYPLPSETVRYDCTTFLAESQTKCLGPTDSVEEQAPLTGFLSVPVSIDDIPVGRISLANPQREYTPRDKRAVERLGRVYGLAIRRKQAEEDLRHQRDSLAAVFEAMEDGLCVIDRDFEIRYANKALVEDFGSWMGRKCYQYFHEAEQTCPWCRNDEILAGNPIRLEWYARKNFKTYDLVGTPLRNPDGTVSKLEIFRDVTHRKRVEEVLRKTRVELEERLENRSQELAEANERLGREITAHGETEKALRESEERLEFALAGGILGLWDKNLDTGRVGFNRRWADTLGYTPEEVARHSDLWKSLTHPEDLPSLMSAWNQHMAGRSPYFEATHRFRTNSGEWRWIFSCGKTVEHDQDGRPLRAAGTMLDITDRKKAEDALRQSQLDLERRVDKRTSELFRANEQLKQEILYRKSIEAILRRNEERYRAVVEDQSELICRFLADGTLTFVNEAYCRYFGRRSDELLGKQLYEMIPECDKNSVTKQLVELNARNRSSTLEHRAIGADGRHRWQQWTNRVILDEMGNPAEFQAVGRDITDRKNAEDQLLASLKEKDVLLQEIHHRVKNNLAVIHSLLGLQSGYVEEEVQRRMFKDAQARVKSMALAHEKLYQSRNLAALDINEYVDSLTDHLVGSSQGSGYGITLIKEIEDVSLKLDTAIPLGFILTELVSNCLRHAFPNGEEGTIHVSLKPAGADAFELVVRDDGVGMPKEVDLKNSTTFGLDLVDTFVQQLGGKIETFREHGTEIRLQFTGMKKRLGQGGYYDTTNTPDSNC
jgi:PAS domain S-box-containing protein